ncbi:uncharacterized protein ColSpa_02491 [Colletotrichum spaethianum]|uniref:Uncharacterized protein n=1 Tax=Colletotrichum spaethianum TaxID=700344 RepID=A0AA37LAB7_9PEZI|nr:uncharacterized protein ColSpa_02491 [Colletotrichum spaethianum]GKT42310.1 hypothetical protein ColSpa_02491 [Colletotrichum spaethianum]
MLRTTPVTAAEKGHNAAPDKPQSSDEQPNGRLLNADWACWRFEVGANAGRPELAASKKTRQGLSPWSRLSRWKPDWGLPGNHSTASGLVARYGSAPLIEGTTDV